MSKSSVSAMVRGAGMAADVWGKIDEAVRAKGGTEETLHQLARPEGSVFIEALADLLVKSELKIWRTIKVGTGLNSADDFRKALQASNCKISDYASSMLDDPKFVVSSAEQNVNLGNASVAELGFDKGARYYEICARIIELGHQLCEPEDGPQLRKQHLDQLPGEEVRMAMEPLRDSLGYLYIFYVGHGEGGLWLYSIYGFPGHFWHADRRFVFRLCKRPLVA